MTSLQEKLGFLSDTDFAVQMLRGEVHIPPDVDAPTTLVLEEIRRLFCTLQDSHSNITIGAEEFRYYWRGVKERTSSSISGIHFGHYKSAVYSLSVSDFSQGKSP